MRIQRYLDVSPLFALYVTYNEVFEDFQGRLKEEDLHFIQALLLVGLFFENRPVRPSEIADVLCISRSNASHAIRILEKQGWIRRSSAENDARVFLLELTPAGRKKVLRVIRLFDAIQDHFEKDLGKNKSLATNQILLRLRGSYARRALNGKREEKSASRD